ncbi:MAG: metallophosphoesterase family protein, partial [Methanobacteriota archaeon]
MKILHLADTHVGYAAYARLDADGLNQREQDVFRSFRAAVDVALSMRPDAVVHAGDLFDAVRPTNRALSFVVEEVQRLSRAGIPFVVIAGNHDTPRLRETGSPLRLLEFLDGVHPIYKGRAETVE